MRLLRRIAGLVLLAGVLCHASAQQVVFTPKGTGVTEAASAQPAQPLPGNKEPTPWLLFQHPKARNVAIAGSWNRWSKQHPMSHADNLWRFDMRALGLPFGKYEFKFVVDGEWEPGANRVIHVNTESQLEVPSDWITRALVQDKHQIEIYLKKSVPRDLPLRVYVSPETVVKSWRLSTPADQGYPEGYALRSGTITFYLDERTYGLKLASTSQVAVAGNFSGWNGSPGPRWLLADRDRDGLWELSVPLQGLRTPPGQDELLFKFVVDGNRWLSPPPNARNLAPDGPENANLRVDFGLEGAASIRVITETPLDVSRPYVATVQGLAERPASALTSPGKILDTLYSDKPLGVFLDKGRNVTTYRLFAPRATDVHLCLYDRYQYHTWLPTYKRYEPVERYRMWKDADGVWEITLRGLDTGRYYSYNVDGPAGEGEGFAPFEQTGDPYARAAAHAENNAIVIDPDATNEWFSGWTDQDFKRLPRQDAVIYETHVRHLTVHPSSGVELKLRGKYDGVTASDAGDSGLSHIRSMGFNAVEFMPIGEFNNGESGHNWGYSTVFYFAPEGTYAHKPTEGSQYYEFKTMVNELHKRDISVILDVVYNHVGWPNIFSMIDRKYYFRLNDDFTFSNFSGCGNDVRTEAPMMRRLIIDNLLYWIEEMHVDGFRFDLSELIDMDTMRAIEKAIHGKYPDVHLIAEPWSYRGENKHELTGTGWSAWNNEFRYASKDFIQGRHNRDWLKKCIFGSLETWAADPLQPVNYLESHDDMALVDEITSHPDRNGRNLIAEDAAANRLGAAILFTSLGIPMIGEGQEFMRHKEGLHNTYNMGDRINALDWRMRERPIARETMEFYRGLIHLRTSPEGQSLRLDRRPPPDYYLWLMPPSPKSLGYIINPQSRHPGRRFIVLLNASYDPVPFPFTLPEGRWRVIGDGKQINMQGIGGNTVQGPKPLQLNIPGLTSFILMDGF